jgi:predicted PurR-regulated permease PerM
MRYAELEQSTKVILKIVFVILTLGFLWVIRDVLIVFLLAVVLASAMEPLVDYLKIKRIPRPVTVLAVYIAVLGFLGFVLYLIIPPVVSELQNLQGNLPQLMQELQDKIPGARALLGSGDASSVIHNFFISSESTSFFNRTIGIFNGIFSFLTVLVISFYLVANDRGMKKFIHDLVPSRHQNMILNLVGQIQKKMGLWVIGQFILSVAIFAVTFIGLSLLGIKYALFLALLAAVLEIIPYLGPVISAIPAILFALLQNPALAIGVIILYIVVQKTEGYVLVPKIMEKTLGISPLVVLVALLIGLKLAGVIGLLLSVPIAGVIMVIIKELSTPSQSPAPDVV